MIPIKEDVAQCMFACECQSKVFWLALGQNDFAISFSDIESVNEYCQF